MTPAPHPAPQSCGVRARSSVPPPNRVPVAPRSRPASVAVFRRSHRYLQADVPLGLLNAALTGSEGVSRRDCPTILLTEPEGTEEGQTAKSNQTFYDRRLGGRWPTQSGCLGWSTREPGTYCPTALVTSVLKGGTPVGSGDREEAATPVVGACDPARESSSSCARAVGGLDHRLGRLPRRFQSHTDCRSLEPEARRAPIPDRVRADHRLSGEHRRSQRTAAILHKGAHLQDPSGRRCGRPTWAEGASGLSRTDGPGGAAGACGTPGATRIGWGGDARADRRAGTGRPKGYDRCEWCRGTGRRSRPYRRDGHDRRDRHLWRDWR
jgi:hypothetical protein